MKPSTFVQVLFVLFLLTESIYGHTLLQRYSGGSYRPVLISVTPTSGNTRHDFVHWEAATTIHMGVNSSRLEGFLGSYVSSQVSVAMASWQNVTSAYINFNNDGSTSTVVADDQTNVVYWENDFENGPGMDLTAYGLAVTWITINSNQELVQADVVLNGIMEWAETSYYVESPGYWVLGIREVVTHELGHVLGIGHTDMLDPYHEIVMNYLFPHANGVLNQDDEMQ